MDMTRTLKLTIGANFAEPLDDLAWFKAQTRELQALRRKVNDKNLLHLASKVNRGIPCHFDSTDPLGRQMLGGMHVHLRIKFADGTAWLARLLRFNVTSFDDRLSNEILLAECATLRWLETVRIPAPRLYGYGLRNDPGNNVGVAYMLIDELPGRPLAHVDATAEDLGRVYLQLADILNTISQHPFDKIGSLFPGPNGEVVIGPITGDRTGTLSQIGPFDNGVQYYVAWTEEYLRLISDGQLFSQYPVDAYLMFRYLRELAMAGTCNGFERELDTRPFFLKHTDDKGDHILVDDQFNITGIIDWSFARIVPAYEAFGPSLATAELGDLLNGTIGFGERDRLLLMAIESRVNSLARFARAPDRPRRFMFGLGMGMNLSLDETLVVFRGLLETFDGSANKFDWETWRSDRIAQWADDPKLEALLREVNGADYGA